MGEAPGTVAVLEPEFDAPVPGEGDAPAVDAHSMDPVTVLTTLAGLGGSVDRVLVVGCEPAVIDEGIGLTAPVADAVEHAVDAIEDLLTEIRSTAGRRSRS